MTNAWHAQYQATKPVFNHKTYRSQLIEQGNKMQVQVHTDHHIEGHESLVTWATSEVKNALSRHIDQITRVEVHLSEENGHKGGKSDKRCMLEARLQGRSPLAVTHHEDNLHQAVTGAADKLNRMIESAIGRASRIDVPPPVVQE
jgi:ribosome-associated translation inhibitor RaiA